MSTITKEIVTVSAYFPAGDASFWLQHKCLKIGEGTSHVYICEDCGKEIYPKTSQWMDEYWCIKVFKEDHQFEHPVYQCTDTVKVVIPCIDKMPQLLPDVIHENCHVDVSCYAGYTVVKCLDCGRDSVLAINSFSVLTDKSDYKSTEKCNNKIGVDENGFEEHQMT